MRKTIQRAHLLCITLLFSCALVFSSYASTTSTDAETQITGTVTDIDGEPLAGVNIRVKDKVIGTTTDVDGTFSLTVRQDPPLTLIFSIIGFASQEVEITTQNTELNIRLEEETIFGSDIVVSASRVEESILKSPVSIEKMDILDVQSTASTDFYSALQNLKGVDFSTQSLTFKSINARGFGANGNTRFVQLIDGIDNQAPGLNFAVGNIVGISELDLESAELIPGAASALYGPNALNGILLMNSKSAFDYQGLSFNIKSGINHIDSNIEDPSFYQSYNLRYAKAFNNKFAFKVNASYLQAQDFAGEDFRNQTGIVERGATSREASANPRTYDGLNVYGDFLVGLGTIADGLIDDGLIADDNGNLVPRPGATAAQIGTAQQVAGLRSLIPNGDSGTFSPVGYTENSFVDNTTESLKFGTALNYRITDEYEIVAQYNIGYGSTVYTANDRFVLDDFSIWTGKLELRNPNFFLRAYTTQEDAGDSYAANTLASLINQEQYLPAYFQTFLGQRSEGRTVEEAHAAARTAANSVQQQPGSQGFDQLADSLRGVPISEGGARFLDRSDLYQAEGLYNFQELIDPSDVQLIVGGNYRVYALESEGTLFALDDNGDEFSIQEWGAYVQAGKDLMDGDLNLSASLRYDKNENFDGQFSPRASATYTAFDNHTFRASFQRGFRIPTTQDQFIDLDVVTRRLIGSNPVLVDRYNFRSNTVYQGVGEARDILASGGTIEDARAAVTPFEFDDFQPEKLTTFEVGYKSLIGNRLFIDAYYYFSNYTDFIAEVTFTQGIPNGLATAPGDQYTGENAPGTQNWTDAVITGTDPVNANRSFDTQSYGFDVNADGNVRSHGFAVTADYALDGGYTIGGNVSWNRLIDQDDLIRQGFRAQFNTPEWRYNLKFQNRKVTDNIGFNMVYRWQDAYLWESAIGNGVIPAFGTLDAQVSYKVSDLKTIIKLGGTNLFNERYTTSLANPLLGAIYYISFTFDEFLN
ncbi:MAG: TonB-dependent receptor [Bacteroidota bacterium]